MRPIRTHKVHWVNCKQRVDFCIDMLIRLHLDQLQGVHRRIPVKLRRVIDHAAKSWCHSHSHHIDSW